MFRLFLISLLVFANVVFASDKDKPKKPADDASYVEAMVTVGNNGCGFLLQLSDGKLIKPSNLPKKFQHFDEKVLVKYEDIKVITDSPCSVEKEVNIVEIKSYKGKKKAQGKF
ncbi:MAG TPA: hypothetical protein VGF30_00505 [Bacteroidia bacterium]